MIVDVNTDFLINNKLSANQYLIMTLILADKQSILKDYFLINNVDIDEMHKDFATLHIKGLVDGYILGTYDLTNVKPTQYLRSLLTSDDLFKEFLYTFPMKVVRSDGTQDYLRTDQTKAKTLYLAYTRGKKSIHEHILKCLKHEIAYRESNNSMQYMKRIVTWLNSKEWESFEDQIDDLTNINFKTNDTGYGTELL
jgi:hypothetical protein